MLFNSYIFIFIFLPITLFLFFYSAQYSRQIALIILLCASLIFYSWSEYHCILLLLFSITANFFIGKTIIKVNSIYVRKYILWLGIFFNLSLLAYFKYTDFFIKNINLLFNFNLPLTDIALPIGISFFTFTQIAFLVDCYKGLVHDYQLLNYALFVTYFPHLIAGPIIHHKSVMPQFENKKIFQFNYRNFVLGIAIFVFGLFKKMILADYLAMAVAPVFDMQVGFITTLDAWLAALSYTFELYFDFSGYSDMAIGLSFLIGIRLPVNFYSPYKASNIIEFWRRWNITLSHFLRDYLYIPLGGNRQGNSRRYANILVTMLLGGLWHGASWTFVFWGLLHGTYLCINHVWHSLKNFFAMTVSNILFNMLAYLLTFLAVVVGWVFFRAPDLAKGFQIVHAMFFGKFNFTSNIFSGLYLQISFLFVLIAAMIVWLLPNTYQFFKRYKSALPTYYDSHSIYNYWSFKPTFTWNAVLALFFALCIVHLQSSSIFLYFRF